MIRIISFLVFFFLLTENVLARHITGGELSYVYLGRSSSNANAGNYRIKLKLYRDCFAEPQFSQTVNIVLYELPSMTATSFTVPIFRREDVVLKSPDPCIGNPPVICYEVAIYEVDVPNLPFKPEGYVVAQQSCCRIQDITNIYSLGRGVGATYTTNIPGTNAGLTAPENDTPVFNTSDTVIACSGNYFSFDFGAVDNNNDKLEYAFADAYISDGGGGMNQSTQPPPYSPATYTPGFSGNSPLGNKVRINSNTGAITGIAPTAGIYVLTVAVSELRGGKVINVHRKDLHLKVADCSVAAAALEPVYTLCKDDMLLTVSNNSTSDKIKTYEWDMDTVGKSDPFATSQTVNYRYTRAGDYTIRLITNKNDVCSDTAYATVKVYPGFRPAWTIEQTCATVPYTFRDLSTTTYGTVDSWQWNFGNTADLTDVSGSKTATYTYPVAGIYSVSLVVGTSVGCTDTLRQDLNVKAKPELFLNADTVICDVDTLQLTARGTGTFSWSPNYNISSLNTSNPLVSPDRPTRYSITLTQSPGCINTASVFVDVKSLVTLKLPADTTICLGDSAQLSPQSDAVGYKWTASAGVYLSGSDQKTPFVKPLSATVYRVLATIGKCFAEDEILVKTVPYPRAIASADSFICYGDAIQLFVSGGTAYSWTPAGFINNPASSSPTVKPLTTTDFIVSSRDFNGCPKPVFDTVTVSVIPPVVAFAGNDTVVVAGQPLQLKATGAVNYSWFPTANLSNPLVSNPVAILSDDVTYRVKVSTKEGCFAFDSLKVKVYKTAPEIFVPNLFTPNGDGLNDLLRPIPVGISKFVYFRVYNRFGQLVYSANDFISGWNGKFKGRDQGNESFVWHALAEDYLGNQLYRKGQTTLIR